MLNSPVSVGTPKPEQEMVAHAADAADGRSQTREEGGGEVRRSGWSMIGGVKRHGDPLPLPMPPSPSEWYGNGGESRGLYLPEQEEGRVTVARIGDGVKRGNLRGVEWRPIVASVWERREGVLWHGLDNLVREGDLSIVRDMFRMESDVGGDGEMLRGKGEGEGEGGAFRVLDHDRSSLLSASLAKLPGDDSPIFPLILVSRFWRTSTAWLFQSRPHTPYPAPYTLHPTSLHPTP